MKFTRRSQQGFALILVLLIGALMMIPVLMLLSAVAPRRASVTGEAVSDIALASADGVVDRIATQINGFPTLLSKGSKDINSNLSKNLSSISDITGIDASTKSTMMAKFVIGYLLSIYLNGRDYSAYSDYINHLSDIQKAVSTYLYDTKTGKYYAVWSTNHIASVDNVGARDIASKPIQDLSAGMTAKIADIDNYWSTDNRWIEIDTNTQFSDAGNTDTTSRFIIRATAYPLSNNKDISGRMRTVQAEVSLGHIVANGGDLIPQATGVFTNAMWSGSTNLLTLNSKPTIKGSVYGAGNIEMPAGGTITGDLQAGGTLNLNSTPTINGNVFATGSITVPAGCMIGGNIQTGGGVSFSDGNNSKVGYSIQATNSITTNTGINLSGVQSSTHSLGSNDVLMSTGVGYTQPLQSAPDFDFGATSSDAMRIAKTAPGPAGLAGDYSSSTYASVNVGKPGSALPYYIGGSVKYNNGATLNFQPTTTGSTVGWYVGGDLTINNPAVLNFGTGTSASVIYVAGTVNLSSGATIKGHGTIIANKVNSTGPITGAGVDPKIAIIATGTDNPALYVSSGVTNITAVMYVPIGTVKLSSGGTITGSIVAKNVDASGAAVNITYDNSLTTDSPPLPGPPSVSFTFTIGSSEVFKRSWKELISGKYTVTPSNFTNNNFPPVYVSGDFSK